VIHRDLKPSNVMVGTHGQVYVMDWGIALLREAARLGDSSLLPRIQHSGDTVPETAGSLSGTPSFMAPEQALGNVYEIDERTDVYGLGGILYYLLTLHPPHAGVDAEESLRLARAGSVPPLDDGALPPALCRIIMRALAERPADRHASVFELKRDVEAFLRGGGWFSQRRFVQGSVILQEGGNPDAAYIIQEGQCDLFKAVGGEQTFVCTLGPGEVFGETAIFTSGTRTATVLARTDVTAIVVTREALERELDRSPWLRAFVRAVALRFVDLDRQLVKLRSDPPDAG
jgi:serine/threonine-protein kinase